MRESLIKGESSLKSKKPEKDWAAQLQQWAAPLLGALAHPALRRWAPVYRAGLLGPGQRNSATALAEQVAAEDGWQTHHFVATSPGPTEPLEAVLAQKAQQLVGGPGTHLIVDDTVLVKQGRCWAGLRHHVVPGMIAFSFLQHSRLAGKESRSGMGLRLSPACQPCGAN
jgi:SRSO17 transposase